MLTSTSRGGILLTGGSGRLGRELLSLLANVAAPSSARLDVTDTHAVLETVLELRPAIIVHAAAFTDVRRAEAERERCWAVNVEGTRNVARAARAAGAKLIHLSTDYVFSGERGHYREDDAPGPTRNYYALTKLVAEEAARCAPDALIVRTSFRPREWPYPTAFSDLFTSQDYVDVIAPEIAQVVWHAADVKYDTLHVATERKSVLDLARRRFPGVQPASKASAGVPLPDDVSLDISRWQRLKADLGVPLGVVGGE